MIWFSSPDCVKIGCVWQLTSWTCQKYACFKHLRSDNRVMNHFSDIICFLFFIQIMAGKGFNQLIWFLTGLMNISQIVENLSRLEPYDSIDSVYVQQFFCRMFSYCGLCSFSSSVDPGWPKCWFRNPDRSCHRLPNSRLLHSSSSSLDPRKTSLRGTKGSKTDTLDFHFCQMNSSQLLGMNCHASSQNVLFFLSQTDISMITLILPIHE